MLAGGYTHEDFPDESGYGDGALTHVLERLMSYAVLATGHHCREVMSTELAAVNYSYLEYRSIALGGRLPAYPRQQIKRIVQLKRFKKATQGGEKRPGRSSEPAAATPPPRRRTRGRFRRQGET
jgi:hypothetical protein